jgi:hypothetical protein
LDQVAVMGRLGGGQTRVQLQHGVHQFHHTIMRGFVGAAGIIQTIIPFCRMENCHCPDQAI